MSRLEVNHGVAKPGRDHSLASHASEGSPSFDRVKPVVVLSQEERWYFAGVSVSRVGCPGSPRHPFELAIGQRTSPDLRSLRWDADIVVNYHDAIADSWLFWGKALRPRACMGQCSSFPADGGKTIDEVDLEQTRSRPILVSESGGEPGVYCALLQDGGDDSKLPDKLTAENLDQVGDKPGFAVDPSDTPSEMYSIFAGGRIHRSNDQGWPALITCVVSIFADRGWAFILTPDRPTHGNHGCGHSSLWMCADVAAMPDEGRFRGDVRLAVFVASRYFAVDVTCLGAVWGARKLARWR